MHNRYTRDTIIEEAQLYIQGHSIPQISKELGIPVSTVSWHLIHPLEHIRYLDWLVIRYRLIRRAKNPSRADYESWHIDNSGIADRIADQWEAVDEERRLNK